jgi:NAD(P)-dependent dehydrogenase (short-subunit alcohol dehydrogenase family)
MGAVWRGRFSAKSVIVTGGASGIGAATAERFLREGASVLIIDSNMPALGRCMALLEDAAGAGGGRCVGVHGDVTSPSDVVCMLERALQEFGALDILISNAGVSHTEPFLDIPLVNWAHGVRVNAVCPGYIVTPMAETADTPQFMAAYVEKLPLGHLGRPEHVAGAFAFLASDDAAFITGETLVIDGGQLTS